MEVIYTLTEDDVLHGSRFVWRRVLGSQAWTYRICGAIIFIIGAFGFGFYCLQPFSSPGTRGSSATFHLSSAAFMLMLAVSGAGMMWMFSEARMWRYTRWNIAHNEGVLGSHTVRISPQWFQEVTSVNDTKMAWKTMHGITEDEAYLYFFATSDRAHVIPKRAFPVPGEAEEFLASATAYWKGLSAPVSADAGAATWPPAPQRQR